MIIGYTGQPGSGKTTALAKRAMDAQRRGKMVFSNINIKGTYKITLDDLIQYRFPEGSVVIIDEAGRWFNSRKWAELPPEVFDLFTMHRHLEMDMFIGVQSFARIDKSLREVIELVYWARNSPWLPFHKYEGFYDLEKSGSMRRDYDVMHRVWKTRKVRGMFNTYAMKNQFSFKDEVPLVEWDSLSVFSNKSWLDTLKQNIRIKIKTVKRKYQKYQAHKLREQEMKSFWEYHDKPKFGKRIFYTDVTRQTKRKLRSRGRLKMRDKVC